VPNAHARPRRTPRGARKEVSETCELPADRGARAGGGRRRGTASGQRVIAPNAQVLSRPDLPEPCKDLSAVEGANRDEVRE
jgi:hypothetical protein